MISRRSWLKGVAALAGGTTLASYQNLLGSPLISVPPQPKVLADNPYEKMYKELDEIYVNSLQSPKDVAGFRLEGQAKISFPNQRMRMENVLEASLGQKANFVYWCPEDFPDNVSISWDYWPLEEPGLSILFFAATGRNGEDIFDPSLTPRAGEYQQYHHGDIMSLISGASRITVIFRPAICARAMDFIW